MNFIELCLNGDALANEIDDYVDKWHTDDSIKAELHDYLGMTWGEYSIWAAKPSILPLIFKARVSNTPIDIILDHERLALAARAETVEDARKMEAWLKLIGKIK